MTVKTAVNKAMEDARSSGVIGAGLEAEITLYADEELKKQLLKLGDELRFVLITSSADVKDLSAAAGAVETELEGLKVSVVKSGREKCSRCWHRRDDIGSHDQHPELCGRCVENIDGEGEQRAFA